ncbi:hypothetical protein QBC42DRAFT_77833 [Cladorrhinum samala]|uniref:Uncharacterized protein n=1 Tax=Cladorrhinum samala TaxID=585594 RepID=A0AAV9HPM0_9PEZI|nr:hypothetical protein QBC42DRAFT_77833 [Cladorrhinum samala]
MDERGQKSKQMTKPPQGDVARKPLPRFFIFKGSPRPQAATPQRIAAQQIANLFKKAGVLPTNEVVEFNLADLPSPPTKAVMKAKATEARGKLLFIRDPGLLRPTAGDAKSFSQTSSLLSRSKHALLALVKAAISTQHPIVVVVSGTPLGMEEMVTRNQALFDAKHWGWDQVAWSFPEERKDSPVRADGETGSDNISEFGNQPHNPPTFENQPGESPESGSEPQQLTSQPQPQPDTTETVTESSEVQIKP